jgi:hypothetical protein
MPFILIGRVIIRPTSSQKLGSDSADNALLPETPAMPQRHMPPDAENSLTIKVPGWFDAKH